MKDSKKELASSLYRIIRFDHLVEIFQRKELFISHPSNWEDPYETILCHKYSESFFAQCWCKNGVSDAMWRIYSPNQIAVRIRTTREQLETQLHAASEKLGFRFMMADVQYLPQMKVESALNGAAKKLRGKFNSDIAARTLFLKRDAFSHEAEVRIVIYPNQLRKTGPFEKYYRIPIEPHDLIRGVLVDPRAPEAYVEAYKHYLHTKLHYRRDVRRSLLYSSHEPITTV